MSNLFEKTCFDINDKILSGSGLNNIVPKVKFDTQQQVSTNNYVIFGYTLNYSTIGIIIICLIAICFLIYNYFFKKESNIINIKKVNINNEEDDEEDEKEEEEEDEKDEKEEDEKE